jgi:hypothetical protein
MKSKTITFFDWSDIQTEICKEMGIEEKYFRDYHKVIGGEYKDLWHAWMDYFEPDVTNGKITSNDMGNSIESTLEWVKGDGKEWMEPFVIAIYKVWDDNNIEYVQYSW